MRTQPPSARRRWITSLLALLLLAIAAPARANINPWIQAEVFDSRRWDSAGGRAATPWLHPPAYAADQGWGAFSGGGEWSKATNLTGDWGGTRSSLMEKGFGFAAAYFGQFSANPIGGEDEGGVSWRGDLATSVFVDFERALGLDRTYFTATADWKHGTDSLSTRYIGNQFPVQMDTYDEGSTARLSNLALGKQLFENTTEVVGGRLITSEDFGNLRLACTSVNQALCAAPINAVQNLSFPTFPNAVWGGRVRLQPGDEWYGQVGSYLVYPGFTDSFRHGIDFGTHSGAGALTLAEVGYLAGSGSGIFAQPGTYKLGGYYDTEQVTEQETQAPVNGTGGLYLLGEQHLWPPKASMMEGLSAWAAASWAPPDRNELEYMLAGGFLYTVQKNTDGIAAMVAYGRYSQDLRRGQMARGESVQGGELLVEVNYRHTFAPWLWVQPDVQGIVWPDGRKDIPTALVIGFALGVVF